MSQTQDAIARSTASTNALLASIQTELQQVASGLSDAGDQANADAINALSDKLDAAKVQLDADDVPAAPVDAGEAGAGDTTGDTTGEAPTGLDADDNAPE